MALALAIAIGCVAGCGSRGNPQGGLGGAGGGGGAGGATIDAPQATDTRQDTDAADDGRDPDVEPDPGLCTTARPCDPTYQVCVEDTLLPSPPGADSCGTRWECFTHFLDDETREHPCPVEEADFCGCDGVTFRRPWFCPHRPYDHPGACGDGFSCDSARVRCADPEPTCPAGQVAAVVNNCWGPCIPFSSCRCEFNWQCRPRETTRCADYPDYRCFSIASDGGTDTSNGDGARDATTE